MKDMTNPSTPQDVTLREAVATVLEGWTLPTDARKILETAFWSHPPAPEQASGELVASADCPLCGKDTPHGHGTEDIAEWLRIQARRFVGANADDLIRINTSEVHLIDSLRRQIQELEHRVESLTPETSYENYGKSDAELKALFATTKEEATHNGIEFLMHGKNMAFKIGNQMFAMAYEPDEPGDFEFMKGALLHALSTITPNVKVTFLAKLDQANTKDAIAQVVDRFLGWKLPKDFGPDAGISFTPPPNPEWWPTGTNLFTAVQTKQMLEYLLSASPAAPEDLRAKAIPLTDSQRKSLSVSGPVEICAAFKALQPAAPEAAKPEQQAALKTLEHLGYTYHGGELWKPPLGNKRPEQQAQEGEKK